MGSRRGKVVEVGAHLGGAAVVRRQNRLVRNGGLRELEAVMGSAPGNMVVLRGSPSGGVAWWWCLRPAGRRCGFVFGGARQEEGEVKGALCAALGTMVYQGEESGARAWRPAILKGHVGREEEREGV
jgi:hypothetical protein